ncbi:MAG: sxtJ [Acidiferrobacteraceae bacterium]|nr:sxtJ [Acidiferrobacteraceae bacterium]|tara:strand:+ start:482 stop:889 length:408 start_codon:yes stop_codon:yes gene_type:complete
MRTHIPDIDSKGLRNFGYIFGVIVIVLFGLVLPFLFGNNLPLLPWVIGGIFFIWASIWPKTIKPFYRLWMSFGVVMNWITTRIVLAAVFFVAMLPFGVIFKIRGKDPLNRKWDGKLISYRILSEKVREKNMEKPF